MSPLVKAKQAFTFEDVYKNYSAPLYGMILKFAQNTREAEEILIQSFQSFIRQNIKAVNGTCVLLDLLKITIPIAAEKTNLSKQNIGKIIFKELSRVKTMQEPGNLIA